MAEFSRLADTVIDYVEGRHDRVYAAVARDASGR
jgi:hypothetical protein